MTERRRPRRFFWRMIALLLVAWGLLTIAIDAPFNEFNAYNGAWISRSIENFQEYGASTFHFTFSRQAGPYTPDDPYYPYINHPPMPVWGPALLAQFAGVSALSVRFFFAATTLIGIAALYVLARRLFDETTAFWSALLFTAMPLIPYFGRITNWFIPGLTVGLLYTVVFVNWWHKPSWGRLSALALLAVIGVYTFWIDILYVGSLGIAALVIGSHRQRLQTLMIGVIGVASVVSLLGIYAQAAPGIVQALQTAYLGRASTYEDMYARGDLVSVDYLHTYANVRDLVEENTTQVTPWQLGLDVLRDLNETMTASFLILGLMGIRAAFTRRHNRMRWVFGVLFFVGGIFVLLLPNAVYTHHTYEIYLFPPLAMSAAVALTIAQRRRRWWRLITLVALISGFIVSVYLLVLYHSSRQLPHMILGDRQIAYETTTSDLRTFTREDDHIMSNVAWFYGNLTMEYYADRNVIWATSPQVALAEAEALGQEVIYMHCVDVPETPPGFEAFAVQEGENTCQFYTIIPGRG